MPGHHGTPGIRALLCDIDGVLRIWPPVADLERSHGLPPGSIAAAAFAPTRLLPAITGATTDEQWRAAVAADLAATSPAAAAAIEAWSALVPQVDQNVLAFLTQAACVMPVALVSNATTRLEHDLEAQGVHGFTVINSARIGVAKPDPEIFLAAAEHVGVPAQECLFVDDTAANVDAATEIGMTALLYQNVTQLRECVTRLRERAT
jgi:putative hydrolase of the HAD superfamily